MAFALRRSAARSTKGVMQQPPYGQPPYGQQYQQPLAGYGAPGYAPPPQGGASTAEKPVDPVRMIVGVVGCGLLVINLLYSMLSDGPNGKFMALLFGMIEVAGYLGLAAGLSGLRTKLGMVGAGANALAAVVLLGVTAFFMLEIHSFFLFKLVMFSINGASVLAFAGTAVVLATSSKKIGPVAFGGAGAFGLATLFALYFFFKSVMLFVSDRMDPSKTMTTVMHVVELLAAAATAAAFLVGMTNAKKNAALA